MEVALELDTGEKLEGLCSAHARRKQEYFEGTAEDSSGKRSEERERAGESPQLPVESP